MTLEGIDHTVASPFWEFMNSAGAVWDGEVFRDGALFLNPFYATGYPITEPYWAAVEVAGIRVDVLIQCFERRCLTYTPGNPEGWKVEAGNVGQHYFAWRYANWPGDPPAAGADVFSSDLSEFASFSNPGGDGGWNGSSYEITAAGGAAAGSELFVHTTVDDYAPTAGDEIVSLSVRIAAGGPEAFACVTTRYTSDGQGSRRYALCVDGYDTVSAVWETFTASGAVLDYQPLLEFTASAGLASSSEWNLLEIASVGDEFWFLINGDLVGTARHAGDASGLVGFYLVNDGDAPAVAEFRDLSVRATVD